MRVPIFKRLAFIVVPTFVLLARCPHSRTMSTQARLLLLNNMS
jgi:hypothetical protein